MKINSLNILVCVLLIVFPMPSPCLCLFWRGWNSVLCPILFGGRAFYFTSSVDGYKFFFFFSLFGMLDIVMIIFIHKPLFTSWIIVRLLKADLSGKSKEAFLKLSVLMAKLPSRKILFITPR